ncbi:MAG: zf-HC2 domain-containing protein [Nitriliruptorales bacterium]
MRPLSCPEARALVSDYIDGELDAATARALEDHLQTCPNCPPLYASLVETLADLKRLTTEGDVEKVVGEILAALPEGSSPPEQRGAQGGHREGEL